MFDLKTLNSCLRMPAMCDQFQKAARNKLEQQTLKRVNTAAIAHLRSLNIHDKNQEEFFEKYVDHLDSTVKVSNSVTPHQVNNSINNLPKNMKKQFKEDQFNDFRDSVSSASSFKSDCSPSTP